MRLHQVIAAAAPGDAVTGQALAWRTALRGWGADGDVVAEHVHPALSNEVRRLDAGSEVLRSADALVLHYSVWSRAVEAALQSGVPVALYYHNVTPGAMLRPFNPALAQECDRARAGLGRLAGRVGPLIAVSAFNARDLAEAGMGPAHVVPLLLDLPAAAAAARPAGAPPSIVSVGRIVPNKRIDDVLRVFALFRAHRAPGATLTLVGSDDAFEDYRWSLDDLARRIGVAGVRFTGRVEDDVRDAAYADADAYLCMSEHEGFCAPLVEALAHGVPVVARAAAAVPETLGGAGILVDGPDVLPLAAEALHEVVTSERTRDGLAAAGARRLEELRSPAILPLLRSALAAPPRAPVRPPGRVALVVQRYGAEVNGGAEALARRVAGLLAEDLDLTVLTTTALDYRTWANHFPAGEDTVEGVPVVRFPVARERDPASFDALSARAYARPEDLALGAEWMEAQGPDCPGLVEHLRREGGGYDAVAFVTYLYRTTADGIAAVRDRALLVPTLHDEPPARLRIFDEVFASARALVFSTPEERELARGRFGVEDERAFVAGWGVDPPPPGPPAAVSDRPRPPVRPLRRAPRPLEGGGGARRPPRPLPGRRARRPRPRPDRRRGRAAARRSRGCGASASWTRR